MIVWSVEYPQIEAAAHAYVIDPLFVAAIRQVESGPRGREFGVLSVSADTYSEQLRICCETVSHRISPCGAKE